MNRFSYVLAGLLVLNASVRLEADSLPLILDGVEANLVAVWTEKTELGPGGPDVGLGIGTFGVQNVAEGDAGGFGTGDVARVWDLANNEKPELQKDFDSPLTSAFRVDFQTLNQSNPDIYMGGFESKSIRFRMANEGDSITSESRSAFSVSWQADGMLTAKYERGDGGVSTINSDVLEGAQDISLIINPSNTDSFIYNAFSLSRKLDPVSYDVYINGELFNTGGESEFKNGLEFTLTKSEGNFDPALGLGRVGIVGSSDGDIGPDYLFDNVILTTGIEGVPEPSSIVLSLGCALLLVGARLRMRS